ncbi:MAG: MFS transporter [Planctomycetaceae bacterium]|nr:MFS transporter [Planctomycetaceae bacterium]
MNTTSTSPTPEAADKNNASPGNTPDVLAQRRNFVALVLHQIVFRVAWIFKTESVIMPAFLDMIADSGFIRGLLPLLNRFGQSIAPLLRSEQIATSQMKSKLLLRSTISMSLPFICLGSAVWFYREGLPWWFTWFFLAAYTTFFCLHGINETSFSTVQGKLIPVNWRGRLAGASSTLGSLTAVSLAWMLMGRWLQTEDATAYAKIFLFVGLVMFSSSAAILLMKESPDETGRPRLRRAHFREAAARVRDDKTLRGLCVIAILFVFSQILFPHYQSLGMKLPNARPVFFMHWVVAQHLGAALFSSISGRMADRFGTRSALRFLTASAAIAPLLALTLARVAPVHWFALTFFWIGLVPVTFRMQVNYTLEIVPRSQHPAYISTMTLAMAIPFLLSPVIGAMVQQLGFTIPFVLVAAIVSVAALKTWTMPEPRHPDFVTGWVENRSSPG